MFDPELIRFVQGPVMILMAARDPAGAPAIARGLGCAVTGDGELMVEIGSNQWAEALEGLSLGDIVALTFVRPSDYRAVQVKGPLVAREPGAGEAEARAAAYRQAMSAELLRLGVAQAQIDQWIGVQSVTSLRVRPSAAFDQTPGEGAGRTMAGAMA